MILGESRTIGNFKLEKWKKGKKKFHKEYRHTTPVAGKTQAFCDSLEAQTLQLNHKEVLTPHLYPAPPHKHATVHLPEVRASAG